MIGFDRVRRLGVALMVVLVLAACGAPAAPPAGGDTSGASAAPAAGGPIVVRHAAGEVRLDRPAQRVVACSEEALDFVLALGMQPVGFCSARVEGAPSGAAFEQPHFFGRELLGTPVFVGSSFEPSLEAIIALKPDLILIPTGEGVYEQLSQIAPTMVIDTAASGYWREPLADVGRLLGREAQAQQFLSEFDTLAASLREQLAPVAERAPDLLLIYSFAASDGTMVFNEQWAGARLLTQLGFNIVVPEGVALPASGFAPVSPEIVRDTAADTIMVIRPKQADGTLNRYPIDDILDSLTGVRVIHQVIDSTRGSTAPLTDKLVLEDFARLLGDEAGAAPAEPRRITHALGETMVPANPQRIVAITGQMDLDSLLALGITPIAAGDYNRRGPDQPFAPYLDGAADSIEALPVAPNTNLERLVLLKPDLILGQRGRIEDIYGQLSEIAPTIALDWNAPWQDTFLLVAEAVGRTDAARARLAEIEQRTAALAAAAAGALDDVEVSIVDIAEEYAMYYTSSSHPAQLLERIGARRPAAQQVPAPSGDPYAEVSRERLDLLDGDIIFEVTHGIPEQETYIQQLASDPLWGTLRGVQAGRVYAVGAHWYVPTVLTVPAVLDDLERYLLDER